MTTGIPSPRTASPASYSGGATVTPHDTNELPVYAKALHVGVAGTVKVTTVDGSIIAFTAPVGLLPITAKLVWSTGTAATNIVALW